MLTQESRTEIETLMSDRILALKVALNQLTDLERAAIDTQSNIKDANHKIFMMIGGFCAFVGAGAAIWVGERFCQLSSLPYPAGPIGQALFAGTGAMLAFALGASIHQLRSPPPQPEKFKLILDRRGNEILAAAEDITDQIRAMAVPINFWSIRRFHDFVNKINLLRTLELILIKDFHLIEERMKKYLAETKYARFMGGEIDDDLSDAELQAQRARIVRAFRRLELDALKFVQDQLPELNHPALRADFSHLPFDQCMRAFRVLMNGP